MEPLIALREILLGALPTFLLVWILYFYMTRVFFRPLRKTLQKRHELTGGLREVAEANLAAAERKAAEYEEALRAARSELYQQQDQERQRSQEQRGEVLRRSRQQAEEMVGRARQEIRQDVEEAQKRLASDSEQIALSITRTILEPAAALPGSRSGPEAAR